MFLMKTGHSRPPLGSPTLAWRKRGGSSGSTSSVSGSTGSTAAARDLAGGSSERLEFWKIKGWGYWYSYIYTVYCIHVCVFLFCLRFWNAAFSRCVIKNSTWRSMKKEQEEPKKYMLRIGNSNSMLNLRDRQRKRFHLTGSTKASK